MLSAARIAAMERATLDAVPPQRRETVGGWLLGIDDGVVSRARSATPLQHGPQLAEAVDAMVDQVAQRYAQAGQPALFRVPDTAGLRAVCQRLAALGHQPASPTLVQCADSAVVLQSAPAHPDAADPVTGGAFGVSLLDAPDEAWCALFLGDGEGVGAGAAEAASRTRILRRAQHAVYAQVQVDGETVATGMGSYSEGWASVHGMRTRPAHRGRGYASAIVRALAREALRRQLPQMFLQVEQSNTGAQGLYRRLGFQDLWVYRYWSAPAR